MNYARNARTQSRIGSYSLEGMAKASVGDLRPNGFAMTDKQRTLLDNVAMNKYDQKVSGLC
jgi:hypothetical protein